MQHTDATTNKRCGKKNRLTSLTDERKIHQQSNESKELIMCKKSSQFIKTTKSSYIVHDSSKKHYLDVLWVKS